MTLGDPRTRRSMFGIPVLDWTRGRTKGRAAHTLLLWPDIWDTYSFGILDQSRVMRRLWETNPEQMVLHCPQAPQQMEAAWIAMEEAFGHLSWLTRMKKDPRRIGVMARVRTQADAQALANLQGEGFPAKVWAVILLPEEAIDLSVIRQLDFVQLGSPGSEFMRSSPMKIEWARSVRDHCIPRNIPFEFRSWGGWVPEEMSPDKTLPVRDGYTRLGTRPMPARLDGLEHRATFPW